ncbi:hypothetical protein Trydic_g4103 [Trypoxylus dichotomus]
MRSDVATAVAPVQHQNDATGEDPFSITIVFGLSAKNIEDVKVEGQAWKNEDTAVQLCEVIVESRISI